MGRDEVTSTGLADEKLPMRVVETVAAHEGVDPKAVEEPIGAILDPDALDTLFRPTPEGKTQNDARVVFEYYGYEITITATRDIYLVERSDT